MKKTTQARNLVLATAALCTASLIQAGDGKTAAPDKSRYTLINPTPAAQMRELSTDRPDKTESPYTVDAGHFQIEMDLLTYERDHDTAGGANTLTESWGIAPINLKVGLCNRTDLQVVLDTYGSVRTRDRVGRSTTKQQGFGDITTRLKVNLWGNDGGTTAFAAMPFVKFPTSQDDLGNRAVEWGLILPLAVDLGGGFGLGLMTEVDFLQNEANRRYHTEFVNSITVSHDLVGKLGGYVEFWSVVSTETDSKWQGTVDLGLTYGMTDNIQLDAGINLGVTKSAPDLQPFLGLSVRF